MTNNEDLEALWLLTLYKAQITGLAEIIKEYQALVEILLKDKPEMREQLERINEKLERYN